AREPLSAHDGFRCWDSPLEVPATENSGERLDGQYGTVGLSQYVLRDAAADVHEPERSRACSHDDEICVDTFGDIEYSSGWISMLKRIFQSAPVISLARNERCQLFTELALAGVIGRIRLAGCRGGSDVADP